MALDAEEIFVAGTGHLYLGTVGGGLPAPNSDPTVHPGAGFVECGYTEEGGVSFTSTVDITEFLVWQSTTAARRSRKLQIQEISAPLVQWNEKTVEAAFGGGTWDTSGGFPTYTFPVAGDALQEYAVVLDVVDGLKDMRIVVPRMNSGLENVEVTFNKDNMATLPTNLKSLASATAPYIIVNDAAAFAPSS
jgi:hypothetical protein